MRAIFSPLPAGNHKSARNRKDSLTKTSIKHKLGIGIVNKNILQ